MSFDCAIISTMTLCVEYALLLFYVCKRYITNIALQTIINH